MFPLRDDALHQVLAMKRQNDDLLLTNVSLEQTVGKHKEKNEGTEEQLRKLEQKISISDISIANQVGTFTHLLLFSLIHARTNNRFCLTPFFTFFIPPFVSPLPLPILVFLSNSE